MIYNSVRWYLGELAYRAPSPHSKKAARGDLQQFIRWWEEYRGRFFDPALLTPADLRAWFDARQHENIAPATLKRALSSLRGYCTWLTAHRYLLVNLMPDLGPLHLDRPPRPPAQPGVMPALFDAAANTLNPALRMRDVLLIALFGVVALHVQETCALQIGDVDLAENEIVVRSPQADRVRRVPLFPPADEHLRRYLQTVRYPGGLPAPENHELRAPLLIGVAVNEPAQPLRAGIDQRTAQRVIRRLGTIAAARVKEDQTTAGDASTPDNLLVDELLRVTPERLRFHAAQALLRAGVSLVELQRILGHRRRATTLRLLRVV